MSQVCEEKPQRFRQLSQLLCMHYSPAMNFWQDVLLGYTPSEQMLSNCCSASVIRPCLSLTKKVSSLSESTGGATSRLVLGQDNVC
jgi:hypothetical protein